MLLTWQATMLKDQTDRKWPFNMIPAIKGIQHQRVVQYQMVHYLITNKFLDDYQSAYRPFHSTSTAVLNVIDDIRRSVDKKDIALLVLLDFSKAFDSIRHDILLYKLRRCFNFQNSSCNLIKSYLVRRTQEVHTKNGISYSSLLQTGVPQGSVLGPLLFLLYINDISKVLNICKHHSFADDLQVYTFGKATDMDQIVARVNSDIAALSKWASKMGLILNASKTQSIIISKSDLEIKSCPKVEVNGTLIDYSDTVKNLGFIVDNRLSWESHINMVRKKVSYLLRSLWAVSDSLSLETRKRIIIAYALPHFIYCDSTLFGMQEQYFSKLELLFNSCIRYVYRLRKYDHISRFSNCLLGCSLKQYYEFRGCYFLFKLLKFEEPKYLFLKLEKSRSSRMNNLLIPKNQSNVMNTSIFVRGISLWNSLSINIKQSNSPASFRKNFFAAFSE